MHHIKAIVTAQSGKRRNGRGFSPDELKEAGLNVADTRRLRVPVDRKRKSSHEENIEALKSHCEKDQTKEPKPPKKKKTAKA